LISIFSIWCAAHPPSSHPATIPMGDIRLGSNDLAGAFQLASAVVKGEVTDCTPVAVTDERTAVPHTQCILSADEVFKGPSGPLMVQFMGGLTHTPGKFAQVSNHQTLWTGQKAIVFLREEPAGYWTPTDPTSSFVIRGEGPMQNVALLGPGLVLESGNGDARAELGWDVLVARIRTVAAQHNP